MGLEIPQREKIKVAIVNDRGEILTLTRSEHEDTRPGERDWPGGKVDSHPDGRRESLGGTLFREATIEEIPGTTLHNVTALAVKSEIEDGAFKTTYLVAATATFPEEGIILGPTNGVPEHIDGVWLAQADYEGLAIPNKYAKAVKNGGQILDRLAELAQPIGELPILVAPAEVATGAPAVPQAGIEGLPEAA